ncbi:MAG: cytochrome c-550 PedF [Phyllobacteriaceae bacterium]|nr:cytochrome c-550 PedF [Phyllobacteriaceae bacterium]
MTRLVSDRSRTLVRLLAAAGLATTVTVASIGAVLAHGDVAPQPVDTTGLETVGADWLKENPYRLKGGEQYQKAIEIGTHGFAANCARCHGLQVISGGIAPDLRYLEEGKEGDAWFINRIRHGYSQNGAYKMPPFEGILSQEAMWAIRSYIETREK